MGNSENSACDVSVLGLGAMGAAIAERLVSEGNDVCVWNRSPSKAKRLESLGARHGAGAVDALQASPISIVVLANADAASEMLAACREALAGRTIVNCSTGPRDTIEVLRALVEAAGGRFLQSSILAYPRNIGHADTYFAYYGDALAFEQHRPLLNELGGHSVFLSPEQARVFTAAFLMQCYVALCGFYEAVSIAARLGLDEHWLSRSVADAARFFIFDAVEDGLRRLSRADFRSDQATIDIHFAAFEGMAASMKGQGAFMPMFDVVLAQMRKARAAGLGGEDISALFKGWQSA